MANSIPELDPDDTDDEPTPQEILSASLIGTVIEVLIPDNEPGLYLRYVDGSVMHVIASDKMVVARLVLPAKEKKVH